MSKRRLTVTVDDHALSIARDAVAAGGADSVSAWVNEALTEKAHRDRRLAVMRTVIAEYEAAHGEITDEEIAAQRREDRANAIVVRGHKKGMGVA